MGTGYDPYKGIPKDLVPTRADESALFDIILSVKEAAKIRHDLQTAAERSGAANGVRRLAGVSAEWESNYARTSRPDAQTLAGLAEEHRRLETDARAEIGLVRGNTKLAKLLQENIKSLFPHLGYSASSGEIVQRLRGPDTFLKIFHPLGVEDNANLIKLLLKPRMRDAYYW